MRRFMVALTVHSETSFEEFTIPDDVSAYAQERFVSVRKAEFESDGKVQTDDAKFHRWLTFARYLSVMRGEIQLSKTCYDQAVELEE